MKVRILTVVLAIVFSPVVLGCSPMLPTMVPPANPQGGFKYIDPPSSLDVFLEYLEKEKDVAVVEIYVDFHRGEYPHDAQTEYRVLHGWGSSHSHRRKIIRKETSCGKPEPYKEGDWYVVIFQDSDFPMLAKYNDVRAYLDSKGEPDYVYTPIGKLPRQT